MRARRASSHAAPSGRTGGFYHSTSCLTQFGAVEAACRLFPIAPIEGNDLGLGAASLVDAQVMDTPAIEVRAGPVEALDAAAATEQMFGKPGMESIAGQLLPGRDEAETVLRNRAVEIAGHRAYRAIALQEPDPFGHISFEADRAAMAPAGDFPLFAHSTVTDLARLRG